MTHEELLTLYRKVVKLTNHPDYEEITKGGARFIDPDRVYVSTEGHVEIGCNTVIATEVYLLGHVHIGCGCIIGPGQVLYGSPTRHLVISHRTQIGARPTILDSFIRPFARIGRHAEVVRSDIGGSTSIQHHAYVGDAEVESHVNIGAGVVVANFDGEKKNKTKIGSAAFVGSNSTIVAPTEIGAESFIGAGSVVRKKVERNSVVVGLDRVLNRKSFLDKKSGRWTIEKPDP